MQFKNKYLKVYVENESQLIKIVKGWIRVILRHSEGFMLKGCIRDECETRKN